MNVAVPPMLSLLLSRWRSRVGMGEKKQQLLLLLFLLMLLALSDKMAFGTSPAAVGSGSAIVSIRGRPPGGPAVIVLEVVVASGGVELRLAGGFSMPVP